MLTRGHGPGRPGVVAFLLMTAISQRSRPRTFGDVIGQEHVTDILAAATASDRLGHAYLFSGPRGVGKTTSARLLAMAVSCGADGTRPCGSCTECTLVQSGSHPDVIELDAASNNSVEDVRDLREKAGLASLRGGRRVFILDEAHMLSRAAANALLKTLEEPPPHLIFVLATTEPEKLPPTVLSRCQHYRFRRLSDEDILSKLESICRDAGAEYEQEALELVARNAEGAMRDAESLLERLLAPGASVTLEAASAALGLPPEERLRELAGSVAAADLEGALGTAAALYRDGFAPRTLAERLNVTLRDALVNSITGAGGFTLPLERSPHMNLISRLDEEQERFLRHDDLFSLEVSIVKAVNGMREPTAPAAAPAGEGERSPAGERNPAAAGAIPDFDPLARPAKPPASRKPAPAGTPPAPEKAPAKAPAAFSFHAVRSAAGGQLRAFLMPAADSVEGTEIRLDYPADARFHYTQIMKRLDELEKLVEETAGPEYTVQVTGPGGPVPAKKP